MLLNQNIYGNPIVLVIAFVVMIFALIFHNVTQAFVASKYGDQTPRYTGYLSFDFKKHLDPIGVLFLLLLGLGWSQNVPVNKRNYPSKGYKEVIVWYSGPASFFLVAFVSALFSEAFRDANLPDLSAAFYVSALYAVFHGVIHLFPVWPLDGAKAALAWGNRSLRDFVYKIQSFYPFGFIVFFFLMSALGVFGLLENIVLGFIMQLAGTIL